MRCLILLDKKYFIFLYALNLISHLIYFMAKYFYRQYVSVNMKRKFNFNFVCYTFMTSRIKIYKRMLACTATHFYQAVHTYTGIENQ